VELARTGEEAIEAYSAHTFDVVLMDVSMPGIGGLTALECAAGSRYPGAKLFEIATIASRRRRGSQRAHEILES